MKRLSLFVCLMATVCSLSGQMNTQTIKTIIEQEVATKRSKSIIVGIVDKNGIHLVSAGVKSDKDPQLPDGKTIYELGSIGKLFTSLIMAEMSLRKELDYNDPVSKFLPKTVKIPSRNGKEISLLHLSTHRSGLPRMPFNMDPKDIENLTADYTATDLFHFVSAFELSRDIDSKWSYSNVGYGLLGQALMMRSGKDFETLERDYITGPLGMNSTMIKLSSSLKKNWAKPHTEYGRPSSSWTSLGLVGAGAASSNMDDMLKFAAANVGLIPSPLYPAMQLTHIKQGKKDGNDGYITMGWTIMDENHEDILWKDGGTGGYRTFIGIDKKNQYGLVILSNSSITGVTDIGLNILDSSYSFQPYQYKWNLIDTLYSTITKKGIEAGISLYHKLKEEKPAEINFDPQQLNYLGVELRKANQLNACIKIFELNASEYPKIPTVYESLAETHRRNGSTKTALIYYEKCLELEPQNPRWPWLINKVKKQNKLLK